MLGQAESQARADPGDSAGADGGPRLRVCACLTLSLDLRLAPH
jgi:hypothetical protein